MKPSLSRRFLVHIAILLSLAVALVWVAHSLDIWRYVAALAIGWALYTYGVYRGASVTEIREQTRQRSPTSATL